LPKKIARAWLGRDVEVDLVQVYDQPEQVEV
jgi:hypothetical protein